MQIRSDTPEDYVRNTIYYVNESQYQTNAAIKEATSYEESDKPLWTLENLKNNTMKISGENASRVHYVESFEGEQKVFTIFIFVVKDDKVHSSDSAYGLIRLDFFFFIYANAGVRQSDI